MNLQENLNYERIAEAIKYIKLHFREQPNLDDIASHIHLSPYHFQKLFTEWAGTSPKKFLQYISVEYAKSMLKDKQATIFDAAMQTGLSGTGRLHDLFVKIEGMTPAEYKNGGRHLSINYSFAESPFGNMILASTSKGICHMAFYNEETMAYAGLQNHFPDAEFRQKTDKIHQNALHIFSREPSDLRQVKLHLKGTDFQLKVWQALLKIPSGHLSTYSNIGVSIQNPNASRAVGTAIGNNPVAFLIPCHRVIRATGIIGDYMWGNTRKTAIIGWEAARADNDLRI